MITSHCFASVIMVSDARTMVGVDVTWVSVAKTEVLKSERMVSLMKTPGRKEKTPVFDRFDHSLSLKDLGLLDEDIGRND